MAEEEDYDFGDNTVVTLPSADAHHVWRVRQLIPYLDYLTMVRYGIIPPIPEVSVTTKLRPLLHKANPVLSGQIMETVIQMMYEDGVTAEQAFNKILQLHNIGLPDVVYQDYIKALVKIQKQLSGVTFTGAKWQQEISMPVGDTLVLQGHPDFMLGPWFGDIKTSVNFRIMAVETYLQVLLYHAIGCTAPHITQPDIAHLAIILPLSLTVLQFQLPVKHLLLRQYLKHVITNISKPIIVVDFDPFNAMQSFSAIGSHVTKQKDLSSTVATWLTHRRVTSGAKAPAMQMFISGRKSGNIVQLTLQDQAQSRQMIQTFNVPVFWHTPYFMNMCKPDNLVIPAGVYVNTTEYWPISYPYELMSPDMKYLLSELQNGSAVGVQGVVVHVGSLGKYYPNGAYVMSNGQAMTPEEVMTINIRIMLPYITGGCRLLLETSAGEASRLYRNPYDLLQLVKNINHPNVALCLDTCHVFSAGGDPLQFLADAAPWIKLVHYNDCKHGKGCCYDRHAYPGRGYIGPDIMARIALVAHAYNIPCVVE